MYWGMFVSSQHWHLFSPDTSLLLAYIPVAMELKRLEYKLKAYDFYDGLGVAL